MAWDMRRHPASSTAPKSPDHSNYENSLVTDLLRLGMDHERLVGSLAPVLEEGIGATAHGPPLLIDVSVKFNDPTVRSKYRRTYGSSPNFQPSDAICNGLLRRVEHCVEELVTRKDSTAFQKHRDEYGSPKPLRFELAFRMLRRDTGEWAERSYTSYQKQPLTVDSAKEIVLATHRIVGLFLRRHDKEFKWLDGSIREASHTRQDLMSPSLNGPMSPLCVPPAVFNESSQSFEVTPGYHVELSLKSRNPVRRVKDWKRTVRINSQQTAPLTLFASEDLLWKGLHAVQQGLEPRKRDLEAHIRRCSEFGCQHYDEDAVDIELRVANNLTPYYDHLYRRISSKLCLFRETDGQDCVDFLRAVEGELKDARDQLDTQVSNLNDFEFRLLELRGMGWSVKNPAVFYLGTEASYSRRTIEAALDRIQTGIGDVLRGHDAAVHFTAHKRGHLVVDKALVARRKGRSRESFKSVEEEKSILTSRLKDRIQHDLDTVCKDTCSLDDLQDQQRGPGEAEVRSIVLSEPPPEDEAAHQPEVLAGARQRPSAQSEDIVMIHPNRVFSLSDHNAQDTSKTPEEAIVELVASDAPEPATAAIKIDLEPPSLVEPPQSPVKATIVTADGRTQRIFPLVPRGYSPPTRLSSDSTLISELSLQEAIEQCQSSTRENKAAQVRTDVVPESAAERTRVPEETGQQAETAHQVEDADRTEPIENGWVEAEVPILATERTGTSYFDEKNRAPQEPVQPLQVTTTDPGRPQPTDSNASQDEGIHDTRPASPVDEFSRSKTDIMESLSDTEDADVSMDSGAISKCETRDSMKGGTSTAPSTPGLSSGGDSSPKYNGLTTPISFRTFSGRRDPITPATELCCDLETPESSRSDATVEIGPSSAINAAVKENGAGLAGIQDSYHFPRIVSLAEVHDTSNQESGLSGDGSEVNYSESSDSDADPGSPTLQLLRTAITPDPDNKEINDNAELTAESSTAADTAESSGFLGDPEDWEEPNQQLSAPKQAPKPVEVPTLPISEVTETSDGDISAAREAAASHSSASSHKPQTCHWPQTQASYDFSAPLEAIGQNSSLRHPSEPLQRVVGRPVGLNTGPEFRFLKLTSSEATGNSERAPKITVGDSRPLTAPDLGQGPEITEVRWPEHINANGALSSDKGFVTVERTLLVPFNGSSARSSISSLSMLSKSDGIGARDSVEDVMPFGDVDSESSHHTEYRPQTAGYLGLHETRLVEVGLRGALGDSRRYSLPLQNMAVSSDSTPGTPASTAAKVGKASKSRKDRKRRVKSTGTLTPQVQTEDDDGAKMLPRVMMLFAGMAVASKLFNKQG